MTAAVSNPSAVRTNLVATLTPPPAAARMAGFAQMLDAHRAEPAPAPKPEASKAAEKPASGEEQRAHAQRTADENRQRQLRANRQAGARGEGTPVREAATKDERTEATQAAARPRAEKTDKSEPADPSLADLLMSLNLQAPPAPADTPTATAEGDTSAADPRAQGATGQPDLKATLDTAQRGAARRAGPDVADEPETAQRQRQGAAEDVSKKSRPDDLQADPRHATETPAAWQAVMEQAVVPQPTEVRGRAAEAAKVDLAAAASALSSTGPAADRPAPALAEPTVVHMPTPADAPDFTQALGAQLSVFAKEGVQTAELHLNPAEMGAISVQIAIEGDQAKVDFGADSAATRQLIENGLPELAAALRDAGFTLSGGGVHSQAQPQARRESEGGSVGRVNGDRRGAGAAEEPAAPARVAQRTVRAGGVDLYA